MSVQVSLRKILVGTLMTAALSVPAMAEVKIGVVDYARLLEQSPQAKALSRYLDTLDSTDQLPRTIVYNNNPADNYLLGTMAGNFQDGSIPGKIQFGSGWWFLDQKEGMEWQINALSNLGLISRFVGMLTDSRSFLSYTRHEYFRRILCNMLGEDVKRGEVPHDMDLLGNLVEDICFRNAKNYFGLEMGNW